MPPLPTPSNSLHERTKVLRSLLPRLSASSSRIKRSLQCLSNRLFRRQEIGIIPTAAPYRSGTSMPPGTVAGITLGAVAGFLLLIVLFYYISTGTWGVNNAIEEENIVVRERSRTPQRRRSHRSSRQEVREVREVRRSRSPRQQRIIVEERTTVIPGAPPPPPPPMSVVSDRIVEERREYSRGPPPPRRVDGDDVVEVIEEGSSIVESPRRERRRRSSGYRSVDPNQFAGGDYPRRSVRRSRDS